MKTRARRAGVRETFGLVVEGDTEFSALPMLHKNRLVANCPPIKATNLGGVGSDVKPIGIARRVKPKVVQHQAAGRSQVIVCIDREHRRDSAVDLADQVFSELKALLSKEGRSAKDVAVVVADRAFEAWLLADARGLHKQGHLAHAPAFNSFEGQPGIQNGKGVHELSRLLDRPYGKTIDGPRLFALLDFAAARTYPPTGHGSQSLHRFLNALGV